MPIYSKQQQLTYPYQTNLARKVLPELKTFSTSITEVESHEINRNQWTFRIRQEYLPACP